LTGSNTAEGHTGAGQYHVTGLDLLLKALGLVQCTWEAINKEAAAAALQHGLLQEPNCDLQHRFACQLDSLQHLHSCCCAVRRQCCCPMHCACRCCSECCASEVSRRAQYTSDDTWLESTEFDHMGEMTAYQIQEQWHERRKGKAHQELVAVCRTHHMHSIGFSKTDGASLGMKKRRESLLLVAPACPPS